MKKKRERTPAPEQLVHGLAQPPQALFGVPHLREVLRVSDDVSLDDLAEEAALRLSARASERPVRLSSSALSGL